MATTQERIARVLLSVGVDKRELTNTTKQLDTFNKTLKDLERQRGLSKLAQDSASAVASGRSLRIETNKLRAELVKFGASEKEVERVAREFDRLTESARAAEKETAKVGRSRNVLQRFGSEVRALPAVPLGGGISTDAIGKIVATLGGLNPVAIGAAAAVGALIIGLNSLSSNTKQVIEALIATQEEYFRAIKTGTRESIQEAINQKRVEIEILRARVAENLRVFQEFEANIGTVGRAVADVLDAGGARTLREETQRLEGELRAAEFGLGRLTGALNDTEVAARSAAEAEEQLAQRRQQILDQSLQTRLQTELQVAKLSADNIRERLSDLQREQEAIRAVQESGLASAELFGQLTDRLREIAVQQQVYTDALPRAEQIETAKRIFDSIKKGIEEAVARVAEIKKIGQAIGELKDEFARAISEINIRLREQLAEAERDRAMAVSEARREAGIAEAEAVREAGLERAEIERQSQLRIKQILRQSKFDEENAIQDRNAVALDAARRRRDQEVATENENRREQLRQLDQNLREQLRTIRRRLNEQLRTIDQRYQEQVRRAILAAQNSIRIETERYNRELAIKQQALAAVLNIERNGATQTLSVHGQYWQGAIQLATNAVNAIRSALASAGRSATVATLPPRTGSSAPGNRIPSLASGGRILSDGLVYAHAGEMVLNPRRGQGTPPININGVGMTPKQVGRAVERALEDYNRGYNDG